VFGTGTHPTTRSCLLALEFIYRQRAVRSAVDLGSGTGILSLAAAGLGSETVLAVDINHLAAKTATNNVRLNALEKRIRVICGKAEEWVDRPAELLIANLHYDVVKRLVDTEGFFDKEWFVISGLFHSQAGKIEHVLSRRRVDIVKTWKSDDVWHTICGKTA
jgi:ribosomal protein L11 methyltransferase